MIVLLGLLVVVPGTAQPVLEEIVVTAPKTNPDATNISSAACLRSISATRWI